MANQKRIPGYMNFVFAATAGIGATAVCFPLELLKNRMQTYAKLKNESVKFITIAKNIIREEGIFGFYHGLSASFLRQATYTGVRMGFFNASMEYFTTRNGNPPGIVGKSLISIYSGILGGLVGLPADIALTRMSVDGNAPKEKRRNYRHVFDAIYRIHKEEGTRVLFRGMNPMIIRATITNFSVLVSYAQSKEMLINSGLLKDDLLCHFICSTIAAVTVSVCMLPPDIAKIRLQNMRVIDGVPEYKGFLDVWRKLIVNEGILSLWKGFQPTLLKNGPQTILTFIFFENLKVAYKKFVLQDVHGSGRKY